MHGAVQPAQHNGAQANLFHKAAGAVDDGYVAHAHLVFQDDEETGDEVAHQVLRSEADRQAADAHAGEDGHDVKAELPNRNQDCHAHDHGSADHAQQAAQGVGALASFGDLCQRAFARNGDHRKTGDQQVQDSNQRKSAPENKQDAQTRPHQPRGCLFPAHVLIDREILGALGPVRCRLKTAREGQSKAEYRAKTLEKIHNWLPRSNVVWY